VDACATPWIPSTSVPEQSIESPARPALTTGGASRGGHKRAPVARKPRLSRTIASAVAPTTDARGLQRRGITRWPPRRARSARSHSSKGSGLLLESPRDRCRVARARPRVRARRVLVAVGHRRGNGMVAFDVTTTAMVGVPGFSVEALARAVPSHQRFEVSRCEQPHVLRQ
jgi:hypothetical protein